LKGKTILPYIKGVSYLIPEVICDGYGMNQHLLEYERAKVSLR